MDPTNSMRPPPSSSPEPPAEACLGRIDRYELHLRLEEGSAGALYAARDTVAGGRVSLLLLPAPLTAARGALDQLRGELARVARFRHPGVAHLLHLEQLWELDPAARAETGAEPGVAALVSDLPDGPSLATWHRQFPSNQPPLAKVLDMVWEIAEALDALHGADLVHGTLSAETIRMTLRGPVLTGAALAMHVRQAMVRLGLGMPPPENGDSPRADLLAFGGVVRDLLPTGVGADVLGRFAEPGQFSSARQFAGALREATEGAADETVFPGADQTVLPLFEDEPADQFEDESEPEPDPAAELPPAAVPDNARPSAPILFETPPAATPHASRWVNVALAIAALVALALATVVLLSRRQPPASEPKSELPWTELKRAGQLSPTFVWQATLPAMESGQRLRFRVYGQTRVLAVVLTPEQVTIEETTGQDEARELDARQFAGWSAGDVLAVVKSPDSLAAYRNGVRLTVAPCPLERWRLVDWDQVGGLVPTRLGTQRVGPLVFADDFMHGENELGPWKAETGTWTTHAVDCPIRSANPFSFAGKGDNATASTGYWFWRNYRMACSVHPLADSAFGMSFCRRDAANCYDLRWRRIDGVGTLELSRVVGGQRQSLARQPLALQPYSWVGLSARQLDGLLVAEVDGHELFRVVDPEPLLGGGIALWTDGGEGTVFDDVVVGGVNSLQLDEPGLPASLLPDGQPGTGGECALGGVLLENATVSVAGDLGSRTEPITLFARRNGPRAVRCRLIPGTKWQAEIATDGPAGETVLDREELATPGSGATLSLTVLNREAWVSLGDRVVAYAPYVPVLGRGHCGLLSGGTPFEPRGLSVQPAVPLPSIDNRVQTFTHEQSMQSWNSPVLAWTPDYTSSVPLYWHRSDFWRDVEASIDVATLAEMDSVQTWGLALAAEAAEDGSTRRRWELFLNPNDPDVQLRLPGSDEPQRFPAKGTVRSLALVRRGNRLIAKLNGRTLWNDVLPRSDDGLLRVGRIGRGATDEWAQSVDIRADNVRTYSFKQAPVSWLPASGEWKVTNRWQCDPRWSFFSGVQRGQAACLWNKLEHGDNITIEFYVGPKMDRERGSHYEYAADFNAVICADGRDISSGYSFMFGGWNDRGSQIVRERKIIAENQRITIPRKGSTHRRWFHVKLRKRGNQLAFWVDGALVGTVEDKEPLSGKRFGLWTWDNGFMVAQVRVATDGQMQSVVADAPPNSNPKTPYSR